MTPTQILALALSCAPNVSPNTLQHIIAVESQGNPYAIGVNGDSLDRQPGSYAEAVNWAHWLVTNGYDFDAGIMQVNVRNWSRLGLTPESAFDACTNMTAGGRVLAENYSRAAVQFGPGQRALFAAISAYNTGSFTAGFHNGYVLRVAGTTLAAVSDAIPPLHSRKHHEVPLPRPVDRTLPPSSNDTPAESWTAPTETSWTTPSSWTATTTAYAATASSPQETQQ
jgi:type IV secretion system protein VirB1